MTTRRDHVVLREAESLPKTTLADVLGCMIYQGAPRTLEEMEAAIAQGAQEDSDPFITASENASPDP